MPFRFPISPRWPQAPPNAWLPARGRLPYGSHDQNIVFDRVEEMLDPDLAETLFRKLGGCPMPEKPTQQEEEYIARREFRRQRKGVDESVTRAWRRCWIPTLRRLSSGS